MFQASHRTYLARKAHFARHTRERRKRHIQVGGKDGSHHSQVHSGVGHTQTAGDVEEDILLRQFEAYALLEDSEQHVETTLVEARGRTHCSGIDAGADECLCLDEEGTHTLDGGSDGNA